MTHVLAVPPRQGRTIFLKPIQVDDYALIQAAEMHPLIAQQWRFRGHTPSPEAWANALWSGVFAQFLVVERQTSNRLGLVMAYRHDAQNGLAHVGATSFSPDTKSPGVMLGLFMFFEYLFWTWPLRKLYFEVPEYNVSQFGSAIGRLVEIEGRFREHSFFGGKYWDEFILSLTRSKWDRIGPRLLSVEGVLARKSGGGRE